MKVNQIKENKTEILGVTEDGYDSSIAEGKDQKMFAILSESLYSDAYSSIVRELTSNAVDATVESGSKEPVIVGFLTEDTGTSLIIQDKGTGISEDRAKNIFSKMLASTKEESADQIGSWGLGRLSAFAYSDMFYVITNYEGKKYTYVMVKKQLGFRMELMNTIESDESNGTQIKIPIDYNDKYKFEEAIYKQLAYFDNIYYTNVEDMSNQYEIYEGKTFKLNSTKPIQRLHICMGNVYYPIAEDKFDFPKDYNDNCSAALKFDIAELDCTPSRENLLYTDNTVEAIEAKYKAFIKETAEMYNREATESDDLMEVIANHQNGNKYLYLDSERAIYMDLNIHNNGSLNQMSWSKYPDLNLRRFGSDINNSFVDVSSYRYNSKIKGGNYTLTNISERLGEMFADDEPNMTPKKRRYLSSQNYKTVTWREKLNKNCVLKQRENSYKDTLVNSLNLNAYLRDEWRAIIKEVMAYHKERYFDKLTKISSIVVPDTFEPKAARIDYNSIRSAQGKILLYIGRKSSQASYNTGWGTVFDKEEPEIKDLINAKKYSRKLVIYGQNSDKDELDKVEYLTRANRNIMVIKSASKFFKLFSNISNFVPIEKIMKMKASEYPVVQKSLTALYVKRELKGTKGISDNRNVLEFLNKDIHASYDECIDYRNKSVNSSYEWFALLNMHEKAWLKFAEDGNLLDLSMKAKTDKVKDYVNKVNFIDLLAKSKSYSNYSDKVIWCDDDAEELKDPTSTYTRMRQLIVDVCKIRKVRVDAIHYQKPVIDLTEEIEEVLEEQLTETEDE